MKKIIPLIITFLLLLPSLDAFAEMKTFIKEYTYQASEIDSKVSCRTNATEQVKRILLEELGTYLESHTVVKNYQITKDQILAITAGIIQTEILKERWDGEKYWLRAQIKADPDDVVKSIDELRRDRQKIKELEETRNKALELSAEVEKLKKELETTKADKAKIEQQYKLAIRGLDSTSRIEKGFALATAKKIKEAIEAYFIAYDNGTVLDTRTNLMWAARHNGSGINWSDAKSYCENYRGGGYTDWRMPTQDELATLYDSRIEGKNGYNLTRLIELTKCCPWASETSGYGAFFRFDGGGREWTKRFFIFYSYRALPVRSGK